MQDLARLVSESLARHGLNRPVDYRRLRWSRWFRCESHHSLLLVPSKPGVFAIAEEAQQSSEVNAESRLLSVVQFFEDENIAFVLDRMLAAPNPMRARLNSGRCFIRFVVIEDSAQRASVCSALNEWIVSPTEQNNSLGSHFASSLELTPATEFIPQAEAGQGNLFADPTVDVTTVEPTWPNNVSVMPVRPDSAALSSATGGHRAFVAPLEAKPRVPIEQPSPLPSGF